MNQKLAALLAEVFSIPASQVNPELTRQDVSSWDSLVQMDLVVSVEKEFGVTLEIDDIVRMSSVAGILEVLRSKGVELGD